MTAGCSVLGGIAANEPPPAPMTIVLDTNVLVSGMIVANHPPGRIIDLLRVGSVRLAVDDGCAVQVM